ncbi:MAG: hypothetical protein JXR83_21670 [Deltaproteobacteria bacterium]|nr:hypothetical protein [Deltaproteobacteria bacterium]
MKRSGLAGSIALAVIVALGCGGNNEVKPDDRMSGEMAIDEQPTKTAEGLEVQRFDLNHDRKPDLIKYVRVIGDEELVVRKEYDLNFDGKTDVWRNYNDKAELAKEALDLDFDGRIDLENYFEGGQLVRQEKDLNFDGHPDLHKYYEKGVASRIEADTNNDGKIDLWQYFEKGQVDRIGIDRDGDGNVDDWKSMKAEETTGG